MDDDNKYPKGHLVYMKLPFSYTISFLVCVGPESRVSGVVSECRQMMGISMFLAVAAANLHCFSVGGE